MTRKLESRIGIITGILSFLIFGGFSATLVNLSEQDYLESFHPILVEIGLDLSVSEGFEVVNEFVMWMGLGLFFMVIFLVLATFLLKRKREKWAAVFYCLTGLCLLIGSQTIAFIFAFPFFLCAIFCLFRHAPEEAEGNSQHHQPI